MVTETPQIVRDDSLAEGTKSFKRRKDTRKGLQQRGEERARERAIGEEN